MAAIIDSSSSSDNMFKKKMDQVFKWWDQNGDGYVTQDDVDTIAQNFRHMADESDHENRTRMSNGVFNWWQLILTKAGVGQGDVKGSKLGKQDFVRSMRALADDPEEFKTAIGDVNKGMIKALDKNGDGVLSKSEYTALYKGVGLPEGLGDEAFKRLDRNGNGVIDYAELELAIMEYYLSPDPNAPGQWLFGPPEQF